MQRVAATAAKDAVDEECVLPDTADQSAGGAADLAREQIDAADVDHQPAASTAIGEEAAAEADTTDNVAGPSAALAAANKAIPAVLAGDPAARGDEQLHGAGKVKLVDEAHAAADVNANRPHSTPDANKAPAFHFVELDVLAGGSANAREVLGREIGYFAAYQLPTRHDVEVTEKVLTVVRL